MIRTGSSSEVNSASTLRLAMRRLRPDMVTASVRAPRIGLCVAAPDGPGPIQLPAGPLSDTGGLLLVLVVVGQGSVGGAAGQGQEHVVEGGAVDGEALHRPAGRVDLIQQGPHVGGAAVGGDPDGQAARVPLDRAAAQPAGDLLEGGGVGQLE